jgi:hypothetical protein
MFASSSLTSMSSDVSSEHEDDLATPSSTVTRYDGPFASQPDLEALKYLKDTSIFRVFESGLTNPYASGHSRLRKMAAEIRSDEERDVSRFATITGGDCTIRDTRGACCKAPS